MKILSIPQIFYSIRSVSEFILAKGDNAYELCHEVTSTDVLKPDSDLYSSIYTLCSEPSTRYTRSSRRSMRWSSLSPTRHSTEKGQETSAASSRTSKTGARRSSVSVSAFHRSVSRRRSGRASGRATRRASPRRSCTSCAATSR